MSNEVIQETTPLVECSAFHLGMSVLEASLRNTENSEAIISGLLKGAAEFYGASRASVVEADWDLGIGVITYEWCKDGVPAQRDMLQCLPMEKFPRWRKALRANKPVVISDLQRLEKVYPDEATFFREYGVTTLLAAPFSKRINQGFIAVDDPTRYTDDPVFLFIASYAVVVELNEIKQQQSLLAATKASKYNPEDIHVNFFGGMEIISSKGTLTGEDIKADQCYLLLAYLILNHKKNFTVDTLAEIICPYDELDSPYIGGYHLFHFGSACRPAHKEASAGQHLMDDSSIGIGIADHHIVAYGGVIGRGLRVELKLAGNQSVLFAHAGTDTVPPLFPQRDPPHGPFGVLSGQRCPAIREQKIHLRHLSKWASRKACTSALSSASS